MVRLLLTIKRCQILLNIATLLAKEKLIKLHIHNIINNLKVIILTLTKKSIQLIFLNQDPFYQSKMLLKSSKERAVLQMVRILSSRLILTNQKEILKLSTKPL